VPGSANPTGSESKATAAAFEPPQQTAKARRAHRMGVLAQKRDASAQNAQQAKEWREVRDAAAASMSTIFANAAKGETQARKPEPRSVSVLATVRDGSVGSIYWEGARIRFGHAGGPGVAENQTRAVSRYSLNKGAVLQAYLLENRAIGAAAMRHTDPTLSNKERLDQVAGMLQTKYLDYADALIKTAEDEGAELPPWARRIDDFQTVREFDPDGPVSRNEVYFERFTDAGQHEMPWHISRGSPRRLQLTPTNLETLKSAAELARQQNSVKAANDMFDLYVHAREPELAARLGIKGR